MRQLATLPDADAAQTLADHLQTLRIETRLENLPDGCAVWVLDEDHLPQAKQELGEFTAHPADQRFVAARQAAETARKQLRRRIEEEVALRAPEPRPPGTLSQAGPWTYGLILLCLLVFAAHIGALIVQNGGFGSPKGMDIFLWGQTEEQEAFTSPAEQILSIAWFQVNRPAGTIEVHRGGRLVDVERGEVWRLITPIFLHFGLFHLLFNLFMLWQLGAAVEERRGAWRYLLFILTCAASSNLAQYYLGGGVTWESGGAVFHPNPLFGGMSGVLYGLFGYIWMKARFQPSLGLALSPRAVFWMIGWLFLCMTGTVGPVANTAHVAGLLFGMVIGAAPHLWRGLRVPSPR